jgi:hypothetical protein
LNIPFQLDEKGQVMEMLIELLDAGASFLVAASIFIVINRRLK